MYQPISIQKRPHEIFVARSVRANRGDFASQTGIISALERNPLIRKIYVSTYYPHHYNTFKKVIPISPSPLFGLTTNISELSILRRCSAVFWGGGVDLQDTGSKIKILLVFLRINLLSIYKTKVFQVFQGAGPINSSIGLFFLRKIMKKIDHSLLREPTAINLLHKKAKVPSNKLTLSCDGAILLEPPDSQFGFSYLSKKGINPNQPVLGLNLRRWFHQKGGWMPSGIFHKYRNNELNINMKNLLKNVSQAILKFSNAKNINQLLLIPMYRSEPEFWEDDLFLLKMVEKEVSSKMKVVSIDEDLSTLNLISIFSFMTIMLGTRLHSTILSHITNVPAIHIFYEHKGPDHYRKIGMSDNLIDIKHASQPNCSDIIYDQLIDVYNDLGSKKEKLTSAIKNIRQIADKQINDIILSFFH